MTEDAAREARALFWARGGAILGLLGTFKSPVIASIGEVAMCAGFLALPSVRARLARTLREPMPRAALLLAAVFALATLWSSAPWSERASHLYGWRSLLLLVIALGVFDSGVWKLRLVLWMVAVAVIASVFAWFTWAIDYQLQPTHPAGTVLRTGVTQGLAFAVTAFLATVVATHEEGIGSRLRLALLCAAGWLAASVLFVSAARSAQIGLAVMAVVGAIMLLRGRSRWAVLAAVPIVFLVGVSLAPMAKERFLRGWNELESEPQLAQLTSLGIRTVVWRTTTAMIAERPWLGYGTGAFAGEYAARARALADDWRATPVGEPHNQYLSVQFQAGVLGSAAFAWFLLAAWRQRAPMPYRACALALLACWMATSLANSHFETFHEGNMIMLLLGCLLALQRDHSTLSTSARVTAASTSS